MFSRAVAVLALVLAFAAGAGGAEAEPGALAGTWGGLVRQNAGVAPFRLTVTLARPVRTTVGKVVLDGGRCVGTVRYQRESGAASVFAMRWTRGTCLAGTMWLRPLAADALAYRWQGRYRDGRLASSNARLARR